MSVNWVFTDTVKVPGLPTLPADPPVTITGNDSMEVEQLVNPGESHELVVPSIDHTKIAAFVFHSDQVNVTVNTNNATGVTGGQSFALGAAKALSWHNAMTFSNPITTSISTGIWVVNSGAKATTFRGGFLMNV